MGRFEEPHGSLRNDFSEKAKADELQRAEDTLRDNRLDLQRDPRTVDITPRLVQQQHDQQEHHLETDGVRVGRQRNGKPLIKFIKYK